MKHAQVRIVNEIGEHRYVPESVTKEQWFKSSGWIVQDVTLANTGVVLVDKNTEGLISDEIDGLYPEPEDDLTDTEEDGVDYFENHTLEPSKKRGRKPNSEKHGA